MYMDVTNLEEGDRVLYAGSQATVVEPYDGRSLLITDDTHHRLRVGPHLIADPEDENVRAIDGIGPARADDLAEVRIQTVGDLATAEFETLADAEFSEEIGYDLREQARDRLGMESVEDDDGDAEA